MDYIALMSYDMAIESLSHMEVANEMDFGNLARSAWDLMMRIWNGFKTAVLGFFKKVRTFLRTIMYKVGSKRRINKYFMDDIRDFDLIFISGMITTADMFDPLSKNEEEIERSLETLRKCFKDAQEVHDRIIKGFDPNRKYSDEYKYHKSIDGLCDILNETQEEMMATTNKISEKKRDFERMQANASPDDAQFYKSRQAYINEFTRSFNKMGVMSNSCCVTLFKRMRVDFEDGNPENYEGYVQ